MLKKANCFGGIGLAQLCEGAFVAIFYHGSFKPANQISQFAVYIFHTHFGIFSDVWSCISYSAFLWEGTGTAN